MFIALLKSAVFAIIIILGIALICILYCIISDRFHSEIYRRHLLKEANKKLSEAKSWKKDLNFYLNKMRLNTGITSLSFEFQGTTERYDYLSLMDLYDRVTSYISRYTLYVNSLREKSWNLANEPSFYAEYDPNPIGENDFINIQLSSNECRDLSFLKFLHDQRS